MTRIDELLSHVWMVRTFLKHSEEAEEIDELREVHRELYDFMLAVGEAWKNQDTDAYLKLAHKKYARLNRVTERFVAEQPELSTHTNFQMAARSLAVAVTEIGKLLASAEWGARSAE
jgi:cob(I)alamin adenosyltransferase